MLTLNVAGVQIPIVYSISIPNANPGSNPTQAVIPFEPHQMWQAGKTCKSGYETSQTAGSFPGSVGSDTGYNNTACYCTPSEYALGGNYTHYVRNIRRDNALYYLDTYISDGTHTYDSSQVTVTQGWQGYTQNVRDSETRLIALRFNFPDAPNDAQRRNGYRIYAVKRQTDWVDEVGGDIKSRSYSFNNNWWLNIPYINKTTGEDLHFEEEEEPEDPNEKDPEADQDEEDGGDGDHTPTYDPIPVPDKPVLGAATAGFITMYKLAPIQMELFAQDMFSSNIWTALKNYFDNPMDFLVGINLLPFEPPSGPAYKPKFGAGNVFSNAFPTVANQYVDVDCGYVDVTKYWGSCFDYEPYTKIQIWLPYIGYRDLPVDEIMGNRMHVKYRCDCLTGDCVAFVYVGYSGSTGANAERVICQFYGNCAIRVPFGAVSYDSAVSNSIALVAAAASAGAVPAAAGAIMETGGAAGGLIAGAEAGAGALAASGAVRASAVGAVNGMKPSVHKGGAAGGSTGYMSIQKPYLIRRAPKQSLPSNYRNIKGYPSNIGGHLGEFSGLAVVDDIQLNNIPAFEEERAEIMQWLRGGVII